MNFKIDRMRNGDWLQVRSIYRQGIATGQATFEADAPTWDQWHSSHLRPCRLVARANGHLLGWAALSPVSNRPVYGGVAEVSVYIKNDCQRQGLGSALLGALIEASEESGVWTLQALIFPENDASIRLHRKHGFKEIGVREKMGKMTFGPLAGIWRDVLLMERRSRVVGID